MTPEPVILPRPSHRISRKMIDESTLKVLYRLHSHGYKAYLVGGCVRDLLLGREPKDFDVVTDATPGQVKKLFRNCFLVGRRFRLAHVRFGEQVVEVATFRRLAEADDLPEDPSDHHFFRENVFGTPAEDAFRRDFTINALFYDIETFAIIDYVGGLQDLEDRRLRVIGNPQIRFHEDPVRMLRALEFAARLDFTVDPEAREGICRSAHLLAAAAPARVREELQALFRYGVAGRVLREAGELGLLAPLLAGYEGDDVTFRLLDALDRRGATVSESFALASLFAASFHRQSSTMKVIAEVLPLTSALLGRHCEYFHIASAIRHQARELLIAFFRYQRGPGQRGEKRFLSHPAARDGFELFQLWGEASGEARLQLEQWRTQFEQLRQPAAAAPCPEGEQRKRRRRKRSGKRRRKTGGEESGG